MVNAGTKKDGPTLYKVQGKF